MRGRSRVIFNTPMHGSLALALGAFGVSMYALRTAMRFDSGLGRKLSLVVHVVTLAMGCCFVIEGIVVVAAQFATVQVDIDAGKVGEGCRVQAKFLRRIK